MAKLEHYRVTGSQCVICEKRFLNSHWRPCCSMDCLDKWVPLEAGEGQKNIKIKTFKAFIAKIKPCGCIVGACRDDRRAGDDVSDWIKRGYDVGYVECSERNPIRIQHCGHGKV